MADPKVGRPWMPGYGIPNDLDGALPWRWAELRLISCRNYFLATTRPDGRPHVMPLWGVWHHDHFCFSTAITSIKSKNLLKQPRCAVTIDDGHHCVIVEGVARLTKLDEVPGFIEAYNEKYDDDYTNLIGEGPIWSMKPNVALAFREDDTFSTSATRWEF
jgi:hypothetical protein